MPRRRPMTDTAPSLVCIGNLTIDEAVSPDRRARRIRRRGRAFRRARRPARRWQSRRSWPRWEPMPPRLCSTPSARPEPIPRRCPDAICRRSATSSTTTTPAGECGIWSSAKRTSRRSRCIPPTCPTPRWPRQAYCCRRWHCTHSSSWRRGCATAPRRQSTSTRRRTTSSATRPLCGMPSEPVTCSCPARWKPPHSQARPICTRRPRAFLQLGPQVVVIKLAAAGCLVATRQRPEPTAVPTDVVDPVDSTGAGDAFCGAFAAEHLRSGDAVRRGRSRCAGRAHRGRRARRRRVARRRHRGGAMTRITVINPNTSAELTATITKAAQAVAGAGVTVTGVHPAVGVPSVESHAEEAIAAVGVIEQVRAHQADTDAFVIACFGDTGVAAAREVATCPVVGMTEAALQTACLVAHRFVVDHAACPHHRPQRPRRPRARARAPLHRDRGRRGRRGVGRRLDPPPRRVRRSRTHG